ncbi:MAG TPA: FtsX-like permease family protein, partial [Stellaceae bacterium]|nr:FtsX-like permease family protein [Stellaceae bacterium]
GLLTAAGRAGRRRSPGLRLALGNLYRPGAPTAGIVASLGLGLTVLVAIALVEGNLENTINERLPELAPSFFFIDIQPSELPEFDRLLASMPQVSAVARVPSLRGRITKINGVPVDQATVEPDARFALRSERGLTYAATLPKGSTITAGAWWAPDYHGAPLVSMDAGLARGLRLKLGDTISVDVLGREVTATLANLREIDWTSLGINFFMVFSPGLLDGAPQTYIATARTAPDEEAALERAVTDRLPNVSAIPVKDALAEVSDIVSAIGVALRATAAITLVAGTLVLAGAVAAGHRRRIYEAVVLKVLGATRADVTRAFLIEYGILGLATAAIAAAIGSLAGYLVLTRVMHQEWSFLPLAVASTALIATLLTLSVGYASTWRALGAKSAPYLRNE